MKADPAPATDAAATPAATPDAAATPAPTGVVTPSATCGSHQAGVGTAADGCDYSPNPHNVTKAWSKTYMSNATTNATYALHQSPCNEHQENAMDCSFSPTI